MLAVLILSPLTVHASNGGGFQGTPPSNPPTTSGPVPKNVLVTPDVFYGIRYSPSASAGSGCPTPLDKWDPSTDTLTTFLLTSTTVPGFCNGRGLAWDGTNLWYSVVSGPCSGSFSGDGLIHKVGPTGGADLLLTIPDPYGPC